MPFTSGTPEERDIERRADVCWPKIYRGIVAKANNCPQCRNAGKHFKCVKSQKECGKLTLAEKQNDEIAIDFAELSKNAPNGKNVFVSISRS